MFESSDTKAANPDWLNISLYLCKYYLFISLFDIYSDFHSFHGLKKSFFLTITCPDKCVFLSLFNHWDPICKDLFWNMFIGEPEDPEDT